MNCKNMRISYQLSAIKPVLNHINDSGSIDQPIHGQLEMVATVTHNINLGLSDMAWQKNSKR